MGKEFLAELIEDYYDHLKRNGSLSVVVVNNLKPVMHRFMKQVFNNYELVERGHGHTVLGARKS